MGRLQSGNDALEAAAELEGVQRLLVGGGEIFHPAHVPQPGMFRPDAGIIEARRDGMAFQNLPVVVHQQIGAVAVEHAGLAARQRGRMAIGLGQAMACRFNAEDLHAGVVEEGMEQADGVRAPADGRDQRIRQAPFGGHHLLAHLVADDALKIADHHGIGVRTSGGADAVEGGVHIGDPVAQGLVHGVLEGARARLHGHDGGAQHLHAEHIGRLPRHIDRAHVDDAFEAIFGAGGGGGDAMLARARLRDDALLAHAHGQQDLAQHIVDLVGAGVVQLVALEVDFRAAEMFGHALGVVERRGAPDIMGRQMVQLGLIAGVGFRRRIGLFEIQHEGHQGLGHEAAAENAEMARVVGAGAERIGVILQQGANS